MSWYGLSSIYSNILIQCNMRNKNTYRLGAGDSVCHFFDYQILETQKNLNHFKIESLKHVYLVKYLWKEFSKTVSKIPFLGLSLAKFFEKLFGPWSTVEFYNQALIPLNVTSQNWPRRYGWIRCVTWKCFSKTMFLLKTLLDV